MLAFLTSMPLKVDCLSRHPPKEKYSLSDKDMEKLVIQTYSLPFRCHLKPQDAHRQRTVDWIKAAGGLATAFDVTTKGILHAVFEVRRLPTARAPRCGGHSDAARIGPASIRSLAVCSQRGTKSCDHTSACEPAAGTAGQPTLSGAVSAAQRVLAAARCGGQTAWPRWLVALAVCAVPREP